MDENNLSVFGELFGDSVRVKILEFFLEADKVAFPIDAVVEDKEIGKSQAYELVEELVKKKYLTRDKIHRRKQYYKLNARNSVIKDLKVLFRKLLLSSF